MIDAYTIGITLALEDGVSDGIVAIRRDLAELDVAVAESAAKLVMLSKLTSDVGLFAPAAQETQTVALFAPPKYDRQSTLAAPGPLAEAQPLAPATQASSFSSFEPRIASLISTAEVSAAVSRAALSLPVAASGALPPAQPAAMTKPIAPPAAPPPVVQPMPAPIAAAPRLSNDSVRGPDFAAIARSLTPAAPTSLPRREESSHWTASRPVPPAPALPAINVSVGSPQAIPPTVGAFTPLTQVPSHPATTAPLPLPSAPLWESGRPRVTGEPSPLPPMAGPKPMAPEPPRRAQSAPPAPPTPMPAPMPRRPGSQPESALPPPMSAHQGARAAPQWTPPLVPTPADTSAGSSHTNQPAYAELHLDGATLGRWVTRYIERQVTRPPPGATGFDPRMTPSWAGAPIGN